MQKRHGCLSSEEQNDCMQWLQTSRHPMQGSAIAPGFLAVHEIRSGLASISLSWKMNLLESGGDVDSGRKSAFMASEKAGEIFEYLMRLLWED